MGYWIIVVLIILGGVLVLIAAASIDANDAGEESSVRVRPESKPLTDPSIHAHGVEHQLTQVVFIPQLWFQGEHSVRELDNSGVATELHPVRSSMLSDVAAAVESRATNLRDTITTILVGADDFLAGHSLDSVLNELDRVLDCLARQPAMAVIGSVPDIGPALAGTLSAVPADSITATVAIWNDAIADLVLSYSAEFVDIGAVPVHLENVDGQIPGLTVSAVPDLPELAAEIAGACRRAADRIRSIRAET